jgi:probable selenium-dependent hydroxylase accessory protein YqeC
MGFTEAFDIKKGDVIAITGAGGKTSLMFKLAKELSQKGRVLVTTTTKIFEPERHLYEVLKCNTIEKKGLGENIFVLGKNIVDGKITGVEIEELKESLNDYDYILIEADGSKNLPLKHWKEYEPVIPSFCHKCIGVLNIDLIYDKYIDKNIIHRYEEFIKKYNFLESEKINEEKILNYLKVGEFFRNFSGRKYFYFNGVENLEKFCFAAKIANDIDIPIIMGSIHFDECYRYKKIDGIVIGAGFSRRMGYNKLLLEIEKNKKMIEVVLEKLLKLPLTDILFVGREMESISEKWNIKYIENNLAYLGQSESVKLGVKYSQNEGIAFFPGDQPFIKIETLKKLIWQFQKKNKIIFPFINGQRYSPVIFPEILKKELLKLNGDTGGREVIQKNSELICPFLIESDKEFKDIDTQKDFEENKCNSW